MGYLLSFALVLAAGTGDQGLAQRAAGGPAQRRVGEGAVPRTPAEGTAAVVAALRERLLVKVDRATMAVALEARAPFLDPAVTRAAFAAGGSHVRGFRTKCVLREVARPLLPRFILHRRKRGLSVVT